jgi:hypothetical protein
MFTRSEKEQRKQGVLLRRLALSETWVRLDDKVALGLMIMTISNAVIDQSFRKKSLEFVWKV